MRLRAAAAGHPERGAEAVHRDEAELRARLPRRGSRRRARAEAVARRRRTRSTDERLERVARVRPARYSASARSSPPRLGSPSASCRARCAGREERAVRRLRRAREPPLEVGAARIAVPPSRDGRRVPPQPQREAEPEVRGGDGVRPLARQERGRRRDPDHDRVERLVERGALEHRRAQQRLACARPTACRRRPPRRSARAAARSRIALAHAAPARAGRAARTREREHPLEASSSCG